MFRNHIKEEIRKIVGDEIAFSVERPALTQRGKPENSDHGDYSSNVALLLAKQERRNPKEAAEDLRNKLLSSPTAKWLEKIEVAGPGFLNFFIARSALTATLQSILEAKDSFGKNELLKKKKIMIEYTDPNPFKEFHIGHLMSNTIGESLARIIEFCGAEVKRANYQGDVGLHVAKAIWGEENGLRGGLLNGKAYAAGHEAFENNEQAKKEIIRINKRIYTKTDQRLTSFYEAEKRRSLAYFEAVYEILGMNKMSTGKHFDEYFFESETAQKGKEIVEKYIGDVFEESDGAIVYRGEEDGFHTRVFINSEGLPTYEAKELGLAVIKNEKYPDIFLSIVVTGNEVKDYFKVVLAAEKHIFPDLVAKTKHVPHGMLRFPSGKMSSRTGQVIAAESLFGEVESALNEKFEKNEKLSDKEAAKILKMVVLGAIKYSILRHSIGSDIIFDFEKSLALDGDSGPYIQYVYTRANSVLGKAIAEDVDYSFSTVPSKISYLEKLILYFPDVVRESYENLNPNIISRYLLKLASAFNAFYEKQKIIGVPESAYYIALTKTVSIVIKNGLNLLGISAPEKM